MTLNCSTTTVDIVSSERMEKGVNPSWANYKDFLDSYCEATAKSHGWAKIYGGECRLIPPWKFKKSGGFLGVFSFPSFIVSHHS